MRRAVVALVGALLVVAPAALAQPICPKTVSVNTCIGIKAQLDCIKAYSAGVTSLFTIRLDCNVGRIFDCTGLALDVTGKVALRWGKACSVSARPSLTMANNDTSSPTLFNVGGAGHAALSIRGVDISLGGGRGGILADGGAGVALTSVTISDGLGPLINGARRGGAVYARNAKVSLASSTLKSCAATLGGALYFEADGGFTPSGLAAPLTITGSKLTGNSAARDGGALYAATARTDVKATVSVRSTTASENKAGGAGGALFFRDARASIATSTLTNNKGTYGGALAAFTSGSYITNVQSPVLSVATTSIQGNAARRGGAVHLNGTRAQFSASTCSRNSADEAGGFLFAAADGTDRSNLVRIGTSRLEGNQALSFGGALALEEVRVELAASTLVENSASRSGGGIYLTTRQSFDDTVVAIATSTLRRNKAGEDGGAGYIVSTNPGANPTVRADVQSSTISDNSCAGSGGALFLRDVRTAVAGGFISANSAGLGANVSGGAVHFHATSAYAYAATTLDMQKVTLNSNSAAAGGALYLLKDSTRRVGISCVACKLTDNRVIGIGPGSAIASLDRSQGGEQLTVDLTDTVWAGVNKDGAVCGRADPPPVMAASVRAVSGTLAASCSASSQTTCNHYCLSIM